MAQYYLVNGVTVGSAGRIWPGSLLDSAYDDIAGIQAAGGVLIAQAASGAAAAAAIAQAIKLKGGSESDAQAQMQAVLAQAGILATGSVGSDELATGSVVEAKIGTGAVTSTKLGAAAVQTAAIGDAQVTAAKLGAAAVQTAAIGDAQVTAAKLANGAGIAALVAAGLGNSILVDNEASDPTLLAANATNARACIVVVVVTEALTGTAEFSVESVGGTVLLAVPALTAGDTVLVGAGVVAAHATESAVIVDATAGDTGAISVTILALPTT